MGHSRIDATQDYTDEIELDELAEALAPALAARDTHPLQLRCNGWSGGGGNRTRVRGRTGQNVYKRSPRFRFDRRPGPDALPTA
jgi:hypothetical protein